MWKWCFSSQQSIYYLFGNYLQCDVFVECVANKHQSSFLGYQALRYGHITLLSYESSVHLLFKMDRLLCFLCQCDLQRDRRSKFTFVQLCLDTDIHRRPTETLSAASFLQTVIALQYLFITHVGTVTLHTFSEISSNRRLM